MVRSGTNMSAPSCMRWRPKATRTTSSLETLLGSLHARLRGRRCRPFNSDTKTRIRLPREMRFYYPDASVICQPNPQSDAFQDEPVTVFEVLSRQTRRID